MRDPTKSYPPDCATCRQRIPMHERQNMGCAYEPTSKLAAPQFVLMRGTTPMLDWAPSACPMYLARLPAIGEVLACAPQWKAGTLPAFVGATPTRALLTAVAEFDAARDAYANDPNRPKGGA